jgi:hypothetical protein
MVFRQVIRIKTGLIQALDLRQPTRIDLLQLHARHRLNVVEDPELQCHVAPPYRRQALVTSRPTRT